MIYDSQAEIYSVYFNILTRKQLSLKDTKN